MNKEQTPEQAIPQKEAETALASQNFAVWNDSLQTKDPEQVASLYTQDATFLPTVSGKFMRGRAGAAEYFEHFLQKNPNGKVVQEEVITLDENCYLHSGKYNFEVGPENDRQIVEAEFSFVWQKDEQGQWGIMHHHSSLAPKTEDDRKAWEQLLQESGEKETPEEEIQNISSNTTLRSGVYNRIRYTILEKTKEDGTKEALYRHISPRPEA